MTQRRGSASSKEGTCDSEGAPVVVHTRDTRAMSASFPTFNGEGNDSKHTICSSKRWIVGTTRRCFELEKTDRGLGFCIRESARPIPALI
jgi:hypothetical protein